MREHLDGPGSSPRPVRRLSAAQIRRAAIAAQGLHRPRQGNVDSAALRRTVARINLLQIDSVNVLSRSHYLPLFSRLGPYDTGLLDRILHRGPRAAVEYWAHAAAYVRPELVPAFGWRAERWERRFEGLGSEERRERLALLDTVQAELERGGPATAGELDERISHDIPEAARDHWGWNHSRVREAAETLFYARRIGVAARTNQFERLFAPLESVHVRAAQPLLDRGDAAELLVAEAARAQGVVSADCLADYFRMPRAMVTTGVARLLDDGRLRPVRSELGDDLLMWHAARIPARSQARALLSPFDSMVFNRTRNERLFGFHYRIEIYVPAPRRQHGYYVLPFLLGEDIVARVDLKADREAGSLLVRAAWAEPGAPSHTARELHAELLALAEHLGLERLVVDGRGDLIADLQLGALGS